MKNLIFTLLVALLITACGDEPKAKVIASPTANDISISYEMVSNSYQGKDQSLNQFVIQNNSEGELAANWTIYFNQTRTLVDNSVKGSVKVSCIKGDYYKIEPAASYNPIPSKGKISFSFETNAWIIKNADFPCGFYIVFKDTLGKDLAPQVLSNISYAPLTKAEQVNRIPSDSSLLPTPQRRYENNKIISDLAEGDYSPILPTPTSYKKEEGSIKINANTVIYYDKKIENEALYLQNALKKLLRLELEMREGKGSGIELSLAPVIANKTKEEAYNLKVSSKGIQITAASASGVFYGIQSFRALIPVEAYNKNLGSVIISACSIADEPRFAYRGMFLDVARNFHSKESVKKLLDLMSFYKLNKFHFHLMDDEGWRIEIEELPELTEVGSKRGHTLDESDMLNPTCGSGPFADAAKSNGTGFYSKADFIEILKYATKRHIEVIPEMDFPGHARAAIISMKARYNKYIKTDPEKASEYLLHDPNDSSKYYSVQNYNDNVVCVAQESVYHFLNTVVENISDMYEEAGIELKTIHTGGDEVPHPTLQDPEGGAWVKSPICIDFMNKSDQYKNPRDLFYYYISRFNKILSEKNITTAGWEEIGLRKEIKDSVETINPNMDFVADNVVPYVWNTVWGWGNEDRGYTLANAGFKVVLSNVSNLYFDLAVNRDPLENGYYWGGFVSLRRTWSFVPFDIGKGITRDRMGHSLPAGYMKGLESLTTKGKSNILGIQGQLWSETIKGKELMEYMIFPRMIALAERAWAADPAWTSKSDVELQKASDIEWNKFVNTLGKRDLPRLEFLAADNSVNYRIPLPGAKIENDSLYANMEIPGFTIEYSFDNKSWTKYSAPVAVKKGTEIYLKALNIKRRESRIASISTHL